MSEQQPSDPEASLPAWVQQLRALQQEEAVKYAGHQFDEEGWHDEDECRVCLESQAVINACRCGQCCRLLIEVDLEDAEREPKIKEKGSPILTPAEFSPEGKR